MQAYAVFEKSSYRSCYINVVLNTHRRRVELNVLTPAKLYLSSVRESLYVFPTL
jgi:hypothetical protein